MAEDEETKVGAKRSREDEGEEPEAKVAKDTEAKAAGADAKDESAAPVEGSSDAKPSAPEEKKDDAKPSTVPLFGSGAAAISGWVRGVRGIRSRQARR